MSKRKLTVKTPGKLMVAGEYAVLERYHHLITMAVNRYVYVTIESSEHNMLNLIDYNLTDIHWHFDGHDVFVEHKDERFSFVKEAIFVTYTYLKEKNVSIKNCTITVKSELEDRSGIKYGLGSSAAVVTAVVTAILNKNLNRDVKKELIFKLASLAHINVQGNGSGADIAASTYGGMLVYTSFQAEWLLKEYERTQLISILIEKKWPYLSINQLPFPTNFYIKIGWTGTPASTGSLVRHILTLKSTDPERYEHFLKNSERAVEQISRSIKHHDFESFLEGIRKNRTALATLGKFAKVDIETEKLRLLSECAEHFQGAGKLSGAGGGDCGIAFVPTKRLGNQLANKWEQHGIKPLDLTISKTGSELIY